MDNLTIKQKILLTLDANSSSSVIPFFSYTPYAKAGYKLISESLEINNLKAISWIYNLDPVEFPVFELTDSESKQLLTAINLEWNSPRIQLDVLFQANNSGNWSKFASYSLLNPSPYPYREFSLGDHVLGDNSMIGFQIINASYGVLRNTNLGQDKVNIVADLSRNIVLENIVSTAIKIANTISTLPNVIVNANSSRKGLLLFNDSSLDVYLDVVSTVSTSTYMVKISPGSYWEAPAPVYTGNYYAVVASGSTGIDIREFT